MKKEYRIGKNKENDIQLKSEECLGVHAKVIYDKGAWVLHNLSKKNEIYIGNNIVLNTQPLVKDDVIKIGNQKMYWNDYLYEGEMQEVRLKDLFTFHGRISRANFRALSVLALGSAICVFFLPALLDLFAPSWVTWQLYVTLNSIEYTIPIVYLICYPLIAVSMIMLAMKRIRDTGNPIWKLLLPILNLRLLYFEFSKR